MSRLNLRFILSVIITGHIAVIMPAGAQPWTGNGSGAPRKGGGGIFSLVVPIGVLDKIGPLVSLKLDVSFEKDGRLFVSGEVPVQIDAVDISSNSMVVAGVATTYYLLDAPDIPACLRELHNTSAESGTCSNPVYTEPILLPEGEHSLNYFAVDRAGNIGEAKTEVLLVDETPPAAAVVINGKKIMSGATVYADEGDQIEIIAADPVSNGVSSGLKAAHLLIDITGEECEYAEGSGGIEGMGTCENQLYFRPFQLPEGEHVIHFTAEDNVNNSAAMLDVKILVNPKQADAAAATETLSDSVREASIRKHYLTAEKMLADKFSFKEVEAEYRRAVALASQIPGWQERYFADGRGKEPAYAGLAAAKAERIVGFINWTGNYSGEPSDMQAVNSKYSGYSSTDDFLQLLALRPQWVLEHKTQLAAGGKIPWKQIQPFLEKKWQYSVVNPVNCSQVGPGPRDGFEPSTYEPSDSWVQERIDCFYSVPNPKGTDAERCLSNLVYIKPREDVLEVFVKARTSALRETAYQGISLFNPPNAYELLLPGLDAKGEDELDRNFAKIRKLNDERFIDRPIVSFLKLYDSDRLEGAAYCDVLKFGDKAVPYLEKAYFDAQAEATWTSLIKRSNILSLAAGIKTPASFEFAEKRLHAPEGQLRSCAATAIYSINPGKAAPILKSVLKSNDPLDYVAKVNINILLKEKGGM